MKKILSGIIICFSIGIPILANENVYNVKPESLKYQFDFNTLKCNLSPKEHRIITVEELETGNWYIIKEPHVTSNGTLYPILARSGQNEFLLYFGSTLEICNEVKNAYIKNNSKGK